jgi:CPA1 family monovalent cation:H+ antiporter
VSTLLLTALLVAGIVVLTPLADRVRLPLPVLLTMFGLVVPLFPGVPGLSIEPDLILPVILPPLLFAATQRSSAREFRVNARPILLLAVGLTVVSAAAVAVVAHWLGLGWGAAWVLGAVVAPPDPVAATAVARRLRLPDRLVTLLEGEGMFNDATALVLYSVAVLTVVTGGLSSVEVAWRLLLAVVGGVAVGLVAGEGTRRALAALHDPAAETTVTVAVPFAAYLVAEEVHGSGVLAVLTLGLFLRSYAHPAITSAGWLLGRAVWSYADYVITSAVFVLIGFELTAVLEDSSLGGDAVGLALAVVVTVVAVRFLWTFPAAALARSWRRRRDLSSPYGFPETTVVSWAGMRGVVTVATALALPMTTDAGADFPHRAEIVVAGLVTVLVTLVVQGLTLPTVVRLLGVGAEGDTGEEVTQLRLRAAQAGLDAVHRSIAEGEVSEPVRRAATAQYEGYLEAQQALQGARAGDEEEMSRQLSEVLRRASEAERDLVLDVRRRGEVSAAAADEVLQDVESRALRDVE